MKKYVFLALLLCILLTAGCGREGIRWTAEDPLELVENVKTPEENGPMDYEVPRSVPKVLVNQVGYKSDSRKVAFFEGEVSGNTFDVVDAVSRETVYTGKIEKRNDNGEDGSYYYYGVFTEYSMEGTYYIKTEKIGRSYNFAIGPDVYDGLFEAVFEKIDEGVSSWTLRERGYAMAAVMTSYELYPDIYEEELGTAQEQDVPAVVSFLREQTEELAGLQAEKGGVWEEDDVNAELAGVFAQFSGIIQKYDKKYSTECLNTAKRAWESALKNKSLIGEDDMYYAASQLFRRSGDKKCHQLILDYNKAQAHENSAPDMSLFGDVTYLSTEKGVNMEVCRNLMEKNMKTVEEIAELSQEKPYLVASDDPQENQAELLHMMVKLAVVDYVITNHEYATVMENHLHYFLGRNPLAVSMVPGFGDSFAADGGDGIPDDPVKSADFLFMMSAVMNHDMDGQQ